MPVVINTNSAATAAANNLNITAGSLQKSLSRLSSGSRITSPADDAGGLAVSMRMGAALRRTDATNTNVQNAVSFLQTQDGALRSAGKILDRIAELKTLSTDVTKTSTDVANYDLEFDALKNELTALGNAQFNGVTLFNGAQLAVNTSEDAAQSVNISRANLTSNVSAVAAATDLSNITTSTISTAITNVGTSRAQNGAETSRLQFASEMLAVNKTNLEAANSRIADVDVAAESTAMARFNILQQAGTAMLAQANQASSSVLRLLQ